MLCERAVIPGFFSSALSIRFSSRIHAARGVSRGGSSGTTTRRPPSSAARSAGRRKDGAGLDGADVGFRDADARSGLTNRVGASHRRGHLPRHASPLSPLWLPKHRICHERSRVVCGGVSGESSRGASAAASGRAILAIETPSLWLAEGRPHPALVVVALAQAADKGLRRGLRQSTSRVTVPAQTHTAAAPGARETLKRSRERSVERSRERYPERSSPLDPESRESASERR